MKRFGNLFPKVWDICNVAEAHRNAMRGKRHYKEVQMVEKERGKYLRAIQTMLRDKTFKNSEYEVYTKMDKGKEREIYKLPYFPDRIIHHCIMQVMEQIWNNTLIADTYSSIKNRGIHKGVKRVKAALKDRKNTQYCLKMDVRKFYPSIDHAILKTIIRKKIKDPDLLWLLDEIIDSASGVPIGNYLSQYFGNLYLSGFDHWMKEVQRYKYYFRYCDDIIVLHADKEHLHKLRVDVEMYLKTELNLTLKDNWQVFPVRIRGIDFLGYRFFHDYTLLRKSIATNFKRQIATIKKRWKSMSVVSIVSGIMSYLGWMKYANCHNLRSAYIDPLIKSIVSFVCKNAKIRNPLEVLL